MGIINFKVGYNEYAIDYYLKALDFGLDPQVLENLRLAFETALTSNPEKEVLLERFINICNNLPDKNLALDWLNQILTINGLNAELIKEAIKGLENS